MFTENAIFFISYIIKQKTSPHHCENVPCDSDRIQTCNLLIRSQMLYSVELRSHTPVNFVKLVMIVTPTGFKPVTF